MRRMLYKYRDERSADFNHYAEVATILIKWSGDSCHFIEYKLTN